ncbi:plasmid stabilization protein [Actinocorallia populi]|uniref:plasmid stabilization protein n=1 Tax=Actinocorallia populi TaxID=2079200 RepID=UPI000D08B056|nr:plasmid stabilization protein [Actinocorallia populi]
MPQAWNDKRERQYEHIKQSQEERGTGERRAKEIAARTVNKNRARSGEAREASRSSLEGESPQRRGGKHSGGSSGGRGRTRDQLYEEAKRRDIPGRSNMTKSELEKALDNR